MSSHQARKTVLIRPQTQLRWGALVLVMMALVALFQGLVTMFTLSRLATGLPADGAEVMAALPRLLLVSCGLTALFTGPVLVLGSVLMSFRIFGPVHHMEKHLRAFAAGEAPGTLRLRKKDELHELADAINEALGAATPAADGETTDRSAA